MTEQNDPRIDPVGTVRRHESGRTAVKVSMGDDTGKGSHVWVRLDDNLESWWMHHADVRNWLHHIDVGNWPIAPSAATQTAEQARQAEKLLDEIRAVVDEWQTNPEATGGGGMEAIRKILDRAGSPVTETTKQLRVFFPGDTVPAGMAVVNRDGGVLVPRPEPYTIPGPIGAAYVELLAPSDAEWQAAVDRASAERAGHDRPLVSEEDYVPCRVNDETCVGQITADRLCDMHRHADDCTGCDGPGIVPCAADRVIGNWAYRNGQPIKDLEAGRG